MLTTKLYRPAPRPNAVPRPRLSTRLNQGVYGNLTLVSAPAGFGKTTLVTDWIATEDRPTAWLSLDEGDSDPVLFFRYFLAALRTIMPRFGDELSGTLETSAPPIKSLLTPLLNEMTTMSRDFVLVLDDYHVLDSQEIDAALAFLIENMPPLMHLVITTREDPRLPLARWRARGQLTELRAADLRFTPDEAAAFLNQALGTTLSSADVAMLEARTEGWIAGLQLAAISLQGHRDIGEFIQSFSGSHHFVLDYLVEEVLSRQPQPIHDFLLKTSILNRMCAPLCDAVLQDAEHPAQTILEAIRQANLFLVPLDNERQWFRYHHLFADLLRKRLSQSTNAEINTLHIRASIWYEQHGLRSEAIHHALIAADFGRAAAMIEREWGATHSVTLQSRAQKTWMQALPDAVFHNRPVLSAGYGWVLLDFGELDAADARLCDAERWLVAEAQTDNTTSEMIVVDQAAFQQLPATIAAARTYHALATGDIANTIHHGQRVLALTAEDDHHQRGMAASLLGLAHWSSGELEVAYQYMMDGMERMYKLGNIHFALSSTFGLADIRLGQGRLRDALRIYRQALQVAESQPFPVQGIADLYMGLGDLYREQNDLERASEYLLKSETLGEQAGLPDWRVRFCRAQARMQQIRGDFANALDLLNEAERLYYVTPVPTIRPIAALKARIWIQQGAIDSALAWANDHPLSLNSDVNYLNEFELMTLARIHIAQCEHGNPQSPVKAVGQLLARLLNAAATDQRMGRVIEISLLQAQLNWVLDDGDAALAVLQRALQLAEPEGYVRVFVDEGLSMSAMLAAALTREITPVYTQKLIAAFHTEQALQPPASAQPLIEPLSERELEILRLVAEGLSNREISERLFITLSTVKGHNRNIFDKLQVKRRTEAVARGLELGLIDPPSD